MSGFQALFGWRARKKDALRHPLPLLAKPNVLPQYYLIAISDSVVP